ncbi:MAG: 4-hydroxy-tetrahydrodipicolinate reductase [Candidatus Nanopelagicaceae bacterium]
MSITMPWLVAEKSPLRVGLIGFGKTGKAVATVLLKDPAIRLEWVVRKSHSLEHRSVPEFLGIESSEPGLIYSSSEFSALELLNQHPVDAIVDFSSDSGIDYYGDAAAEKSIAIVSAISAYPKTQIKFLKNLSSRTQILWSPNITLGINFMILAAKTLKFIAPFTDIEIVEEHFKLKNETSGTALRIAEALEIDPDQIKSIRAGGIIGVHEILFGFPFQTVRLKHESISREAFGNGAKFAVEELVKREKGFYSMEELLGPYFVDSNRKYIQELKSPPISLYQRIRLHLSKSIDSFLNRGMSGK